MAEDKHESSVIGFDMLPTEIYHQVGEFLFDNSFSSASLSAVYFYFFLLSLLNSNMYGRVHSAEFWYYGKIQIVLRNRELFTQQSTKHNSSLEQVQRNEQKEEQWETGAFTENSSIDCDPCRSSLYTQQKNYLYEMMHVSLQKHSVCWLENTRLRSVHPWLVEQVVHIQSRNIA